MRPEYGKAYLNEFIRVLRPDGLLIFYMPSEVLWRSAVSPSKLEPRSNALLSRVKQSIKALTPKPLLRLYVKWRYDRQPVMEMYCVKRAEIEAHLRQLGGDILDACPDYNTIPNTEGFRYTVTKH